MTLCAGNPSQLMLGQHLADRQACSTREPYVWRAEWYLQPIDFTNATIAFRMVNADTGEIKICGGDGTASGSATGILSYQPTADEVDTPGIYQCQFTAIYGGATYISPVLQARILENPGVTPPMPLALALGPYLTPPRNPVAFSDEFNGGDPALERRGIGWTVYSSTTGAPMHRRGDITKQSAPALAADEYNSTIIDGVMRIQALGGMHIMRAITSPMQIVARIADPRMSADQTILLQATNYGGAINNASERVVTGYLWGQQTLSAMYANQFWYHHRQVVPPPDSSSYVFLLELQQNAPPNDFDWRNAVIEPTTGRLVWVDEAPIRLATFVPLYAGLEVRTAAAPYSWVEIDFIRSYPAGSWFPP